MPRLDPHSYADTDQPPGTRGVRIRSVTSPKGRGRI